MGFNGPASMARGSSAPTVSVIVPAHNYAGFLPDAVASVRAQTFESWECIVVDDGSTDGSAELLAHWASEDPRIFVLTQARRGVSAARNAGLRVARGALIQFLDADDLLPPEKLAIHVRGLESSGGSDIVYGPTAYFDDASPTDLRDSIREGDVPLGGGLDGPGPVMLAHLLERNLMAIEAPLVRRSILDGVGGFDESLSRMEDWDLWLRCAIAGARFAYRPGRAAAVRVRVHPASASYHMIPMLQSMVAVRQKIGRMLSRREDRALNARRLDQLRAHVGMLIGRGGNPRAGLRYVIPAIFSGRRPRGVKTAARLVFQMTGIPRVIRRRSPLDPSSADIP